MKREILALAVGAVEHPFSTKKREMKRESLSSF
jgi:hypothetical protein